MTQRSAVSLFAGAGGLDLGFEQAGFSVVYSVENEQTAVETLDLNRKYFPDLGHLRPQDITRLDPEQVMRDLDVAIGEVDLLLGGPPCVAFSKSGFHLEYKRQGRDPRAGLLWDYLRFLDALRPRAFVMENVFGLAYRNQSSPFFTGLKEGIRKLGYSLTAAVLNAADYGVPQNRQRVFLIGSRENQPLRFPPPTHWGEHERRRPPENLGDLLPHVTSGQVFEDLVTSPEPEEVVGGKFGHLLPGVPPGRNYLYFTAHEGHPHPIFEWRSRYWTFLLKLDPSRPASTIQAQPGPYVGPFHWENRRLRVPELRRLHGFPDDFRFAGTRRAIQVQVGNAVPPPLARTIGVAMRHQLEEGFRPSGVQGELVAI